MSLGNYDLVEASQPLPWDEDNDLPDFGGSTIVAPEPIRGAISAIEIQKSRVSADDKWSYDSAQEWAIRNNTKTITYHSWGGSKKVLPNLLYNEELGKKPNKYLYDVHEHHGEKYYDNRRDNPEYQKWLDKQSNINNTMSTIEEVKNPVIVELKSLGITFDDLIFTPIKRFDDGIRATIFFDNGYGAMIQRHEDSDGYSNSNYEAYILRGTPDKHAFCYNTKLTNDYVGNLSEEEVMDVLVQVLNYNHKRTSDYEKNTIGWWYSRIVDDSIRDRAFNAIIKQRGEKHLSKVYDNFYDAIDQFTWNTELHDTGNTIDIWSNCRSIKLAGI